MHISWTLPDYGSVGTQGENGTDIDITHAQVWDDYSDSYGNQNWDNSNNPFHPWNEDFDDDADFPYFIEKSVTDFADAGADGIQGTDETLANCKKQETYTDQNWDFEDVWTINEDYSFPYFGEGDIKIYNGTSWELKKAKFFNGTSWELTDTKKYNGSSWE